MIGKIQNYPVSFGELYNRTNNDKVQSTLDAISKGNEYKQVIEELAADTFVSLAGGRTTLRSSPTPMYYLRLKQGENIICDARFRPDGTPEEHEKELKDFVEQFRQDKQYGYTFASKLVNNHDIKFNYDKKIYARRLAEFINKDSEVAQALSETFKAVEEFSKNKKDIKFHIWTREDEANNPAIKFGIWSKDDECKKHQTETKRNSYWNSTVITAPTHVNNVRAFIAETLIKCDADSQTKIESLQKFNEALGF